MMPLGLLAKTIGQVFGIAPRNSKRYGFGFVAPGIGLALLATAFQIPPARAADLPEKLFDVVAAADSQLPRDTFEPHAIVDKVGNDPKAIFRWVRDNTFLVPYQGALRDDIGVLMDRVGNSLDRALLLASLLKLTGAQVRLAHRPLSSDAAARLMTEARSAPQDGIARDVETSRTDAQT